MIPGKRNAAIDRDRTLPPRANGIDDRNVGNPNIRRQRRLHLLIKRKNVRQYEIVGAGMDLAQACAFQHRRQPAPELLASAPVAFDLPEMKTVSDAVLAMGALLKAVAEGDLTPAEAAELTRMVQAFAKIIETAEFEERIRKLEEAAHK